MIRLVSINTRRRNQLTLHKIDRTFALLAVPQALRISRYRVADTSPYGFDVDTQMCIFSCRGIFEAV